MKTFLYSIAEKYVNDYHDKINDYCFVFPNKRCCIFFQNYVRDLTAGEKSDNISIIIPSTIDINSFIIKTTQSVELSKIELLFILYDCYKNLVGKECIVNFDSFARWGEIAIDDFNDIDRALVNAKEILTNTTHFDQIKTDYLTDSQMKAVDEHFRNPYKDKTIKGDNDNMWMHYQGENDSRILHQFKTLWSVLPELYESFTKALNDRHVCYSGMAYRAIAGKDYLDKHSSRLRFDRYIFIGFNALSNSEQKLFDWMKINNKGDFYWDSESPFMTENNIATRFVKEYKKIYKSEFEIATANDNIPEAEIIGIPSRVGQTKFAATTIKKLFKKDKEINNKANTAVVLPDETLCTYLWRSLPLSDNDKENENDRLKINITMGYPMANTPITSLIKAVINLEHKARTTEKDGFSYFYTDILELLAHPLLRNFEPKLVEVLSYMTNNEHKFIIPRNEILNKCNDKAVECYFPLFDAPENTFDSIYNLLKRIESKVNDDVLLQSFIKKYEQSLFLIRDLCTKQEIFLSKDTLAQMMHKLASNETVNFEGKPLEGIQIMGVLETRALDFENVIILSMNEKVYPKKLFRKSLIPYELRQGYKITTPDVQESIFAYYFYRLLSRAKKVYFVYDSRAGEGKSEMSRYLYQIKNIFRNTFNGKLSETQYSFDICQTKERIFEIPKINTSGEKEMPKNKEILSQLSRFTTNVDEKMQRYLSASAINKYIACPLAFFLEYVSDFSEENEALTYVDDAMYGTILHEAFQNFYAYYNDELKINVFDKGTLEDIVNNKKNIIEHALVASFNTNYYAVNKADISLSSLLTLNDIPPELQMLAEFMVSFMERAFKKEIEYLEINNIKRYRYIASEYRFEYPFKIKDDLRVNIKGFIDRIDEVEFNDGTKVIRIVDYKTGSDKTEFAGVDSLFASKNNPKAIFQLFLYSKIFHELVKANKVDKLKDYKNLRIIPIIYKIRTLAVAPIDYLKLKVGRNAPIDVTDFLTQIEENSTTTLEDSFTEKFCEMMEDLYDPNTSFKQTTDASHCDYCRFAPICGKTNKL